MGNLQLAPGSLFANRFAIQRAAGSGGMGMVYRATDRYSGDAVGLKLLHAAIGSPDEAERFAREAQLLSELRHPGIVAHVAHGQTPDGQRFLAMEWLEGLDLGQRLLRGPLTLRDCLVLFEQVAQALSVAHQRGIIHRDLKPSNLFLVGGNVDQVKILDFGIARRIVGSHAMTKTGMIVGTPEYMAPEQARGVRELTPAADLFSLGCVLYECLAGQPPFVADHIAAVLVRILFEEPAPIEDRRPGVPKALSAMLASLLAKDPAQRLADAAALRAEIVSLGDLPEPALAGTVAFSEPKAQSFADQEQGLYSLVLAAPEEEEIGVGATQPGNAVQLAAADRRALLQALAELGGSPDFLANGTLVVTVPSLGSAQDQAALAARAALHIKERWPAAVVAMATGRGAVRGHTALGEVVELAARSLKRGSHPSLPRSTTGVLIDPLSAKLLEGRFVQTPQPGGALLLHEEREVDSSRPLLGKPTPCVGRAAELGAMEAQLAACIEESEARVVLFTASPGIGKSRLRHEFIRRVEKRSEPLTLLRGRGDMMSAGAPYGILRTAIHKLCGISGSEPLDRQREHLRSRIAQHLAESDQDRVVLFIGELCNVPFAEAGQPMLQAARQDPKIMRDCLRRALLDWLAAECAAAPVLLILDDLHWGDSLTVASLDEALREQAEMPLFILAFARPEVHENFPKLWQGHKTQEIPLKGLSKKACERLIQQVLGKDLAPEVVTRAIEQSSGNALFLEELIRSIAAGSASEQPETVLAMLQARIGRLEAGPRRAVRAASIFGQTFWRGGIAALLNLSSVSPEVEGWLSALDDAEMIEQHKSSRLHDEPEYGFRHALVRDAAYSLLTEHDLATGHRLAGEFLASREESDPGQTADHFALAGMNEKALRFLIRAASQHYERCDLDQVFKHVQRGQQLGATGLALGELLALQAMASFLRNDWLTGALSGLQAFHLLPQGSIPWCHLAGSLIGIAGFSSQFELLAQIVTAFVGVKLEASARAAYIQASNEALTGAICVAGMRQPAQAILSRMRELDDGTALCQAHLDCGWATYEIYLGRNMWGAREAALRCVQTLSTIGNYQSLWIALTHLAHTETDLGGSEQCEQTLHRLSIAVQRGNEPLWILSVLMIRAQYLLYRMTPSSLDEAYTVSQSILAANTSSYFSGMGHMLLSEVLQAQGAFQEAERAARAAQSSLAGLDIVYLRANRCLLEALTAQKKEETLGVAESLLQQMRDFGPSGYVEVSLLLAVSEAFHMAGNVERARTTLREAVRQIKLRADDIPDPLWKNSYLTHNPYCARTQKLAQEWELDFILQPSSVISDQLTPPPRR